MRGSSVRCPAAAAAAAAAAPAAPAAATALKSSRYVQIHRAAPDANNDRHRPSSAHFLFKGLIELLQALYIRYSFILLHIHSFQQRLLSAP
jgi:hypothetical protein